MRKFARVGALFPERSIPAAVLDGAAGFAALSIAKVRCQMAPQDWVYMACGPAFRPLG